MEMAKQNWAERERRHPTLRAREAMQQSATGDRATRRPGSQRSEERSNVSQARGECYARPTPEATGSSRDGLGAEHAEDLARERERRPPDRLPPSAYRLSRYST